VKTPDTSKATSRATALRLVLGPLRHLGSTVRSNIISLLALAVALAAGGSYALAASQSNGSITVCVDRGSGVMHLAAHPRCGRHQSRIGLSSALDRPTVSAWAAVNDAGNAESAAGASIRYVGVGVYDVTVTAAACRDAANNAPVVSINDGEPPYSSATSTFPVGWTETASTGVEAFTIYTGVVVSGAFEPRDEPFNFTDSCG
jgi:D-serine deaminase-like pyridoxal phosphate-dependent protein